MKPATSHSVLLSRRAALAAPAAVAVACAALALAPSAANGQTALEKARQLIAETRQMIDETLVACGQVCADPTVPATRVSLVGGELAVAEVPLPESPGRRNKVTVAGGPTSWTVSDPGGVLPGPGCLAPPTGGTTVQCAGPTSYVSAALGSDNDSFKFTSVGASLPVSVEGGQGDDVITVTGGDPTIDGSYNEDVITVADTYPATIYGGPGVLDKITTGRMLGSSSGRNQIYPGPSNLGDMVYDGADVVNGGPGRDYVHSSNGNPIYGGDVVDGGAGIDTHDYSYYAPAPVVVTTDDNAANDGVCSGPLGAYWDNIHSDVERVIGTSHGSQFCRSLTNPNLQAQGDIIFGSAVDNTLDGGWGGNDYVHGRGGDDTIIGEEAVGGTGRDHITGYIVRARDNFVERSITCDSSGGRAYLDANDPAPSGGCTVYRENAANAAISLVVDELALSGLVDELGP